MRLPFALAGCLSVVVFYFLILKISGKTSAVIGTSLFGLSGLFVGFSRIVQYQSFTVLFGLAAILVFIYSKSKYKELAVGLLLGISVSFHYDGLSFLVPIAIFLVLRKRVKEFIFIGLGFTAGVLPYVVLFLTSGLLNIKKNFLYVFGDRLFGKGLSTDVIAYTISVLRLYYTHFLLVLLILLLVAALYEYYSVSNLQSAVFSLLLVSLGLRILVGFRSPWLVVSSVVLFGAIYANKIRSLRFAAGESYRYFVLHWFWVTFSVYFLISSKPLTHVYTFILPGIILISQLLASAKCVGKVVAAVIVVCSVAYLYYAFIDTTPEWPWYSKKTPFGHYLAPGFTRGIFGFPYRRELRKADTTLKALGVKTYYSNEKYRMIKYYFRGLKWNDKNPQAYVLVNRPQSFYGISNPEPVNLDWIVVEQTPWYKLYLRN